MFDEPDLFLFTRLVEIATWSIWKEFPGYERSVFKYLSCEAGKELGPQHPLTLLLGCFSRVAYQHINGRREVNRLEPIPALQTLASLDAKQLTLIDQSHRPPVKLECPRSHLTSHQAG